jgi:F-type H+-transporting ATPase subunit a
LVLGIRNQIQQISQEDPSRYLPFIGTLYLFIAFSNLLAFVPGYHPPTDSLSTTAALAGCVFLAVSLYGISHRGLRGYLDHYFKPTVFMLPFHIISEVSRTLALAVRLFGNVMSGVLLGGILLSVAPLFFPILLQVLELLIGQIQAFIFAVLATVYIASASQAHEEGRQRALANNSPEER